MLPYLIGAVVAWLVAAAAALGVCGGAKAGDQALAEMTGDERYTLGG